MKISTKRLREGGERERERERDFIVVLLKECRINWEHAARYRAEARCEIVV
jgi:hypothetical protein